MPVVSGSTIIRGSRGTPVAQDANDKLITVIQGSQGTPVAQDATDRLIAMMYGSTGNPVAQDANDKLISVVQGDQDIDVAQTVTGELITEMHGSEGIAVKQELTGELISVIQGSEGVNVKQKATGEMITEIVGSTGNAIAQDANDKLISVMQGSQGNAIAQDATNRLIAAIVGSTGNPISQDIADNLVAVMYGSLGNPITQDANDRLVSVMYGSQNTPIAQDAANKLISIMQGSQGTPIEQDASDRLVAMMYGSAGNPISQDAYNNLISVMKGNYLGSLETVSLDKNLAIKAVLYDSEDVWGNQPGVGIGELAVRTHAPPMAFEKRGNVIYFDDYESSTQKFNDYLTGASTLNLSADTAKYKDFSVKCIAAAAVNSGMKYIHHDFHVGRIGVEFSVATEETDDFRIQCDIRYFDGVKLYKGSWLCDMALPNTDLDILDSDGNYYQIGDFDYESDKNAWTTLKIVLDLNTKGYLRFMAFGQEYDISAYSMQESVAAYPPHLQVWIHCRNMTGGGFKTVYFDNYILTDNEPLS